jgi:hypothetical protein
MVALGGEKSPRPKSCLAPFLERANYGTEKMG